MRHARWVLILGIFLALGVGRARADDPAPGLTFSSLLNGVKMRPDTGEFSLDRISAVFLPEPRKIGSSIYNYNPDDGASLQATVSTPKGDVVLRLGFYAEQTRAPFWLLGSYKFLENRTGNEARGSRIKLAPGTYALDFFVQGKKFYHFPFEVTVVKSSDPFDAAPRYFLQGDWSDWGYLYYRDANPDMNLAWKLWLRIESHEPPKSVKPTLEVFRGDTRVAVGPENLSLTLRPEWTRAEFQLNTPPDAPEGAPRYLKAKHILAHDGDYRLQVRIDGEVYGNWSFRVKDGNIEHTGRTARSVADPLTFVEGGKDAWWLERAE